MTRYSQYLEDKKTLTEAIKLADWNIAHSTPGEWAYGNLPNRRLIFLSIQVAKSDKLQPAMRPD